ncbi:uncharacterized protein LOC141922179 [Strix aluco]|uniref:uncharacterized protein LOC141922179 n=1 Tax=Strix aluco TaxID=111821 RepID=UPI003DA49A6D
MRGIAGDVGHGRAERIPRHRAKGWGRVLATLEARKGGKHVCRSHGALPDTHPDSLFLELLNKQLHLRMAFAASAFRASSAEGNLCSPALSRFSLPTQESFTFAALALSCKKYSRSCSIPVLEPNEAPTPAGSKVEVLGTIVFVAGHCCVPPSTYGEWGKNWRWKEKALMYKTSQAPLASPTRQVMAQPCGPVSGQRILLRLAELDGESR